MTIATGRVAALQARCRLLFAEFPAAVDDREIILVVRPADDANSDVQRFYVVSHHGAGTYFTVSCWGEQDTCADIRPGHEIPAAVAEAVLTGIPVPRSSLYGWLDGGTVTALISVYTWGSARDKPSSHLPSFAPLLPVTLPQQQWPPFVGEDVLGWWWWEHYRAGRIVRLAGLIAATEGVVTWKAPEGVAGVHADLTAPAGWTLLAGVYAYNADLLAGEPLPALAAMRAGQPGVYDLAPGLAREAHG